MAKNILLLLISYFTAQYSFSQASIDIDTNIQMGIAGNEHVKITTNNFSIHQYAANPLIYGDFGSGFIGFNNSNPLQRIHLGHSGHGLGFEDQISTYPNIAGVFSTNGGSSYPFNEWGHLIVKSRTQWTNYDIVFVTAANGAAAPRMVIKPDGKVGIGTNSPSTTLDVNGSTNISGSQTVAGSLTVSGNLFMPALSTFQVIHNSGTTNVGTMGYGDTWLITASPRNYGGSDNRGGCWVVGYTGSVMTINQIFKLGSTVSLYDGGSGLVRYFGGGGAPATIISVLKLTD